MTAVSFHPDDGREVERAASGRGSSNVLTRFCFMLGWVRRAIVLWVRIRWG